MAKRREKPNLRDVQQLLGPLEQTLCGHPNSDAILAYAAEVIAGLGSIVERSAGCACFPRRYGDTGGRKECEQQQKGPNE